MELFDHVGVDYIELFYNQRRRHSALGRSVKQPLRKRASDAA